MEALLKLVHEDFELLVSCNSYDRIYRKAAECMRVEQDSEALLSYYIWDGDKAVLTFRKRLLNYILCIRFFIEVHSIVSASRFFHMPTYLRVVIECQSRFFPFFPAFSRNCPDYFLHTSGSSSFRSLSDLGAR